MKTIRIAGVCCNVEFMPTYEQILKMGLVSEKYYKKPNAKKLIIAELEKHGITNTVKESRNETKEVNVERSRSDVQKRNTRKSKRNSKLSTE